MRSEIASRRSNRTAQLYCLLAVGVCLLTSTTASAEVSRQAIIGSAVENWQAEEFAPIDAAIASFRQGDLRAALMTLTQLKQAQPQLPPPHVMLAQMLFGANDVPAGRQSLEQAAAAHPADAEAYVILGELDLREGRFTSATLLFERAVNLLTDAGAEKNYRQHQLLANAFAGSVTTALAQRDSEKALRVVDAWLAFDSKSSAAHARRGEILFFQNDFAGAYKSFQTSAKNSVAPLPAEISMALLYEQLTLAGDVAKRENAQRAMEQAVRSAAERIEVRLIAATWGLESGRLEYANQQAAAALKLKPQSTDAIFIAGKIDRANGKFDSAIARFRAILELRPADAEALRELVLSCGATQQQQTLAVDYARLLHAVERSQNSNILLAWAWLKNGQPNQAAAQLGRDFAGEIDHETMALAGEVLAAVERKKEAIAILTEATAGQDFYPAKPAAAALLADLLKN